MAKSLGTSTSFLILDDPCCMRVIRVRLLLLGLILVFWIDLAADRTNINPNSLIA
jgi:hypothetical protein